MPAAKPKPQPAWKKTLGYQSGDTFEAVKARTVKRVRLAVAAGDPGAARALLNAWQEAKKNMTLSPAKRR